jgi:acetate kinase
MKILVLNAGSSSQKSCLYDLSSDSQSFLQGSGSESLSLDPPHALWEAKVDWAFRPGIAELKVQSNGQLLQQDLPLTSRQEVMQYLLKTLTTGSTQVLSDLSLIDVVGHRVVHGGSEYQHPTLITPEVKETIARLSSLAPAHNPANLEGIQLIETILPHTPQVAVFDTAFHRQMPLAATVYPGPYEWIEQGIRRYGFHGISHEYCSRRVTHLLKQDPKALKLVTCHLGNGCSLAAVQGGHSVNTSMGFTPLEGVMMGTRSGTVDPGILIYLLRQKAMDVDELDRILNKHSGLKGISGESGDMRWILEAITQANPRAQLAFDIYIHRLRSEVGSMVVSLGGLDTLAFTGGVGENAAAVRQALCESLSFLGLKLDLEKNSQSLKDQDISLPESTISVFIIHAEEDWAIAQACWTLLTEAKNGFS